MQCCLKPNYSQNANMYSNATYAGTIEKLDYLTNFSNNLYRVQYATYNQIIHKMHTL